MFMSYGKQIAFVSTSKTFFSWQVQVEHVLKLLRAFSLSYMVPA